MTKRRLSRPTAAEVAKWRERIGETVGMRLTSQAYKDGYWYVVVNTPRTQFLVRVPPGGSLRTAEVLVHVGEFEKDGVRRNLQSWQFVGDHIAYCIADETEIGTLYFLDPATRNPVGRQIDGFWHGSVARDVVRGEEVFYFARHERPAEPGAPMTVTWCARVGGVDGADVDLPTPKGYVYPKDPLWPVFIVHEHEGHQWLVADAGPRAGDRTYIFVADLNAPGSSPQDPGFPDEGTIVDKRGGLVLRDGVATFVHSDRWPHRGEVVQARIGDLRRRTQWRRLIPASREPGSHASQVVWAGDGADARLLVRRSSGGAESVDVHDATGKLQYTIDGPRLPRPDGLFGMTPFRTVDGEQGLLLTWGDIVGAQTVEYRLGKAGPEKDGEGAPHVWALDLEAARLSPDPPEYDVYVWRASYGGARFFASRKYDTTKVAVGHLVLPRGMDPKRSVGTVVEQYNHYSTPQAPHGGFPGPQEYARAWLGAGGGILTVMLQDPVESLQEPEAARGVAAVLQHGAIAGLVRPRTTIVTGTSAAAPTVATLVREYPGSLGLGVLLHGTASRGREAARTGVGANNVGDSAQGDTSYRPELSAGVEYLAFRGLPVSAGDARVLALVGELDTRVPPDVHAVRYVRTVRTLGGRGKVVRLPGAGHHLINTVRGGIEQGAHLLAHYVRFLRSVEEPSASPGLTAVAGRAQLQLPRAVPQGPLWGGARKAVVSAAAPRDPSREPPPYVPRRAYPRELQQWISWGG